MARMVLVAEVSGGRVGGRPRLGWMDGEVSPWSRPTAERQFRLCDNARKIGKNGEPRCT